MHPSWRCRCGDCLEKRSAYHRVWRAKHREEINLYNRDFMRRFRKYGPKAKE